MNSLNDTNLQQIVTLVKPRIHENMIHLVSKRFHRLMLRSVDLEIRVTQSMDEEVREAYVRGITSTLSSVGKIHLLHLYSQWASSMEANNVLMRLAFPVLAVAAEAVGEAFCVALRTLQLELNNATRLPDNTWNLTALTDLDIKKCSRITRIPAFMNSLYNLLFLHIDNCTRLSVIPMLPPNLYTLRITSCPMLALAPGNLQQILNLTNLELEEIAVDALPDLEMLSKLTFLRVASCKNLVKIGALPVSLQTLIISKCHVLTAMPANMHFLSELNALQLHSLHLVGDLGDVSLFAELQILGIRGCSRLTLPAALPVSLVTFQYSFSHPMTQNWPHNLHLLAELQTFEVDVGYTILPDLARLPKLTKVCIKNCMQSAATDSLILPLLLQTLRIEGRFFQAMRFRQGFSFTPSNLGELSYVTKLHIENLWLSDTNVLQIQTCAGLCRDRDGVGFTHLSLKNCSLQIAPMWISEHVGLEYLDLSLNNIQEFPDEYDRLINLRSLLIGNEIESWLSTESDLDIPEDVYIPQNIFPNFIYSLARLECLDISAFFEDIPFLGLRDPHYLAICNMQLARLTHLTSLNISGNRFRLVCCNFATALFAKSSISCMFVRIRAILH